jgi:large subunit ribosomal protein L7/L12
MTNKIEKLVQEISDMNIMECAEFAKALEEKFGVSAVMAAAAPSAGAATAQAEEKTEFKVELLEIGAEKTASIKALRQVKKDLGLIEAKKAVESAPYIVAEAVSKEEAENMKKILEAAGAKVKLS